MSDRTPRDQLAQIINEYMEADVPETVADKHEPVEADYGVADAIIAAGWRPPARVVTTVEELEALPKGTVLARVFTDGSGPNCYVNSTDGWRASFEQVVAPSVSSVDQVGNYLGPLTVLYEPEEGE